MKFKPEILSHSAPKW